MSQSVRHPRTRRGFSLAPRRVSGTRNSTLGLLRSRRIMPPRLHALVHSRHEEGDFAMTQANAKTGNGATLTIPAESLDGLRAQLRGQLCLPGEPGYDQIGRAHV